MADRSELGRLLEEGTFQGYLRLSESEVGEERQARRKETQLQRPRVGRCWEGMERDSMMKLEGRRPLRGGSGGRFSFYPKARPMKGLSQGQRTRKGSRKERVLAWWEGPEGGREMGGRGGWGHGEEKKARKVGWRGRHRPQSSERSNERSNPP